MAKVGGDRLPESGQYWFYCPGCKIMHAFSTKPHNGKPMWSFNGDMEKPTFQPSLLCNGSYPESRCHLFLTDGIINYLSDCHHELADQSVLCQDFEGFNTDNYQKADA